MPDKPKTKICQSCKEEKPLSKFARVYPSGQAATLEICSVCVINKIASLAPTAREPKLQQPQCTCCPVHGGKRR